MSTLELGLFLFAVIPAATLLGIFLGRHVQHLSDSLKEPFGVLQAALLGVVGLLLAFGLSLAVSRYEDRRANIVTEANAIGTTYLRAQTWTNRCERITRATPALHPQRHRDFRVVRVTTKRKGPERERQIERGFWKFAGRALDQAPSPAPRASTSNAERDDRR